MPQKLNKAGKMQDYIPAGNGDASGEYGTSNGTNKNFTKPNVITENKSVVVENKGKKEPLNKMHPNNPKSNVENGFRPDEWEEIYKFSKEINKKNDDLIDETYEIAEKYNLNNKDAIKKLKEKYSNNKANIIDDDLTGKKDYQLDSELVKQANSTKAFYEAGDNIQNKLDYYIKEIDKFDLSTEEKKQAKDKLFNLATDSLKSTSKNMSWVRSGRGNFDFNKSEKNWNKEMKDRNSFESYFNELKTNNEKKIKQAEAKTHQQRMIEAHKKANETGALEMEVDGVIYTRGRRTSNTWTEKRK